ncbi:hypothetical protein ACVIHI_005072 [Bradyrhizobium sp. USDA 4524]|uniref:hypothetical protein n=1 Tax=Bradyrhizobium TaxID=374 RepID=UPI0020A12067|nr:MULTISPECIES: hypothetical protein [Bradyrhizobium]MCP1842009.1 hypothetical protein [Bradyrhizobium sp. USDA 4538]MCP1902573.1 hypothetical protein [Bradyrhizobium sp. USDA 4537]MCP1991770.1 hypothetical protein [Bradyrhizobium sp. USDA 4539]MCP3418279.1 hypothetical protein [Bradyrhizobium brasilense]
MVSTQFKIVTALGMAAMFGVVSFVLGFNVASACATALAGAVSALVVMRAFDGETQPPSKSVRADIFRLGSESRQAWLSELEQQNGRGRKLLYGLSRIFLSGSPCQRIASGGFLAQSVIGLVAIVLFWLGQAMGFDMRLFAIPPFGSLFADGIPMSAEAIAGVRFEHLFLPLVALYAVTFSLFLIALLGDLATILRDGESSGSISRCRCSALHSGHSWRTENHRDIAPCKSRSAADTSGPMSRSSCSFRFSFSCCRRRCQAIGRSDEQGSLDRANLSPLRAQMVCDPFRRIVGLLRPVRQRSHIRRVDRCALARRLLCARQPSLRQAGRR